MRLLRRGFTLIEVMVTLAVCAVLFALIGTILVSFITTQRKVEATLLRERIGAQILEVISRDVAGMYIYELEGAFKGGGSGGAGGFEFVTTREPSVRTETQAQQQAQQAESAMAAQAGSSPFGTGGASSILGGGPNAQPVYRDPPQLTRIAYSTQGSRSNPGLLTLFRSEQLFIPPPPPVVNAQGQTQQTGAQGGAFAQTGVGQTGQGTGPQGEEQFMEVYDRVKSFQVRFLFSDTQPATGGATGAPGAVGGGATTREWRDTWDDPDHYPAAIEVALEISPDPKAEAQAASLGMGAERAQHVYHCIISVPVTNPHPDTSQQQGTTGTTRTTTGGS